MTRSRFIVLTLLICSTLPFTLAHPLKAQPVTDFEESMRAFEELDRQNTYSPESIFFTGSSSIRMWETLERDMAPHAVIQRGFGGSRMADLLYYADRYIKPHTFQAMVLFVANDITGSEEHDITPRQVAAQFEEFILKMKGYQPDLNLFIVEVTPTNARWIVWPENRAANNLIAKLADQHENVIFIPTKDLFLTSEGTPNDELFLSDRLHLNERGYEVWNKRIRSYLDPVLLDR